jgi:K+-sensing histidine kinase KdpD
MDETAIRSTIHDLNNALTTVMGSAELILAETPSGSQAARDAADIVSAAKVAREIVSKLRVQLDLT